jgi:pilus assembly protein TadC
VTPATLVLLAAGIWLSGRRKREAAGPMRLASGDRAGGGRRWWSGHTSSGGGLSPQRLGLIAGAGFLVVALAAWGSVRGGVVGLLGAPLVIAGAVHLARRSASRPDLRRRGGLALTVDLLASALRAGQPVDAALAAVATTADPRTSAELGRVAGLLRLGADAPDAWRELLADPVLGSVARTACRSAHSGIRLAGSLEQLARELRTEIRAAAQARAHRAAIWVMAPLGLCFLPAFVCLGIVPIVIGLARGAFSGLA